MARRYVDPLAAAAVLVLVAATASVVAAPAQAAPAAPVTRVATWRTGQHMWEFGVPAGVDLSTVTALAAGTRHSLALTRDGAVIGWGDDTPDATGAGVGEARVPVGLPPVRAIAAGDARSLALTNESEVVAWGRDSILPKELRRDPSDARAEHRACAIAAGKDHSVAARGRACTVVAWGESALPSVVRNPGLSFVAQLAAGDVHTVALREDGSVVSWGQPTSKETNFIDVVSLPANLKDVIQIAASGLHSLALKSDGTVVGWGSNTFGESTPPRGLRGVVAIGAGGDRSFAIKSDGTAVAWGRSESAQPILPAGLTGITAMALGPDHAVVASTSAVSSAPEWLSVTASRSVPEVTWRAPVYPGSGVTGYTLTVEQGKSRRQFPPRGVTRLTGVDPSKPFVVTVTATSAAGSSRATSVRVHKNAVMSFRPASAQWLRLGAVPITFGRAGDLPVPADYDGDGSIDLAVFRQSSGSWHIRGGATVTFGRRGDIPVPADYNGDGAADIAVYRPLDSTWYIYGGGRLRFGRTGDVPMAADGDRDGRADLFVFRPTTGFVYRTDLVDNRVHAERDSRWRRGDAPVFEDRTGEGAGVSLYRASTRTWFPPAHAAVVFGRVGDVPVPADYNIDGKTEFAVYRPSTGQWIVRGGATVTLGARGDIPLPPPINSPAHRHFGDNGRLVAAASS